MAIVMAIVRKPSDERAGTQADWGTEMSERGADFDAKREAYEAAQGKLLDLVDGPNGAASISEYRRDLKAALQTQQRAHKAMMAAWA